MDLNKIGGKDKIKWSKVQIVHSLAELPKKTGSIQWNFQSSSHLHKYNPFDDAGKVLPEKKEEYWQYLARGFMNFFFNKKDDLMFNGQSFKAYAKEKVMPKMTLADQLQGKDSDPKIYVKNQLAKDWNEDIALIITVGHGAWYKHLVEDFGKKLPAAELKANSGRQLETTEFVLMKWIKGTDGKFQISTIMDFPKKIDGKDKKNRFGYLARNMNVGDGLEYDEYGQYEEYGDYDELDGYGQYADYYYDDDEASEYEIYEEAKDNLVRAQQQFDIAQRLVGGKRKGGHWNGY